MDGVARVVWVSGWEMECCGHRFEVGGMVSWTLSSKVDVDYLQTVLGRDEAGTVTSSYDHHGSDEHAVQTQGVVESIRAVYCRFAPRPGGPSMTRYPVEGTGDCEKRRSAHGWEPGREARDFVGYVVELQEAV